MAEEALSNETLHQLEGLAAQLARFPYHRIRVDYDAEVDCLYLSFRWPQQTTDSEELEDGIIVDYRDAEIVGVTVLNASKRKPRQGKKALETS